MSEETPPPPIVLDASSSSNGSSNTTIQFMFHESLAAYSGLYLMALFCIIIGAKRSVQHVKRHIDENVKIENSVLEKEAKWFPITASCVLFSLYIFFKYGDKVHEYYGIALSYIKNSTKVTAAGVDTVQDAMNASIAKNITGTTTTTTDTNKTILFSVYK